MLCQDDEDSDGDIEFNTQMILTPFVSREMKYIPTIKLIRHCGSTDLKQIIIGNTSSNNLGEFVQLRAIFDGNELDEIEPFPLAILMKFKEVLE